MKSRNLGVSSPHTLFYSSPIGKAEGSQQSVLPKAYHKSKAPFSSGNSTRKKLESSRNYLSSSTNKAPARSTAVKKQQSQRMPISKKAIQDFGCQVTISNYDKVSSEVRETISKLESHQNQQQFTNHESKPFAKQDVSQHQR